jgi:hypothetical protein
MCRLVTLTEALVEVSCQLVPECMLALSWVPNKMGVLCALRYIRAHRQGMPRHVTL